MGDKREKIYRYRNLKVVVWKDKNDGKPTVTIGRGYKPLNSNKFVNLSLNLYSDNVPELIKLLKDYINDYPVEGFEVEIKEE